VRAVARVMNASVDLDSRFQAMFKFDSGHQEPYTNKVAVAHAMQLGKAFI
jgi:hypothetical protein